MLCSICTINYIAWPSIVDTQRSYKPTSWREWETEMEKRSRVLDCVRGHDVTGYNFFSLFLFRMFRFSFSFTFVRFHSARVLQFFSSTANHLCHPYESMMNYRRPHYYAPVFFQFKQIHCHVFAISAGAKSDEYHSIWFYEWNSASS